MNLLSGNQKQVVSQFQNKSTNEQAEQIAKLCNDKGITKEQLQNILNMVKK